MEISMNNIKEKYLKDETILWQGKPEKVPTFNKLDFLLVPFSLVIGGMMLVYAVVSAIMMFSGQGIMFSLAGITALLLGVYFIFLRLWYRKKRISREVYFVTDKRVFAVDTMRDNVIFDIPLENVVMYLGDHSLILGETNSIGDFVYGMGLDIFFRKFAKETPAFRYIEDIKKISDVIVKNIQKNEENADESPFI